MKGVSISLIITMILSCQTQVDEKFNLGFEKQKEKADLPEGWDELGNYDLAITDEAYSGTKSVKVTSTNNGNFGTVACKIPVKHEGKVVKLEGYMKIKEVQNGFAGLALLIIGNEGPLASGDMQDQNIIGTKDWQKYSITLDYPEEAEIIIIAGTLTGKGEAWFDNFALTIDGKDIQILEELEPKLSKAQLDREFNNGSSIDLSNLTTDNIKNLELLGRVWGFIKYYHPEVAKGNYNWDYELFRFLPKYIEATTDGRRDELIIDWIDSLGRIEECSTCKPTDEEAILKPDLEWVDSQNEILKIKLLYVYANRSQGRHYYIGAHQGVGNPNFKNENSYPNMPYPDDGIRLLALYRYWNMINYFFPYKYLMDKDWNTALGEYVPLFLNAKSELQYEKALLQIIGDVQDSHANLTAGANKIGEWKGDNYPPVHVRFVENRLVVVDYYNEELEKEAGLKIGDIITKVNGEPIKEIIDKKSKYYPASNISAQLRDISEDILRSNSTDVEVEFYSENSKIQDISLKLYPRENLNIYRRYKKSSGKSYKMLDSNIGYITLGSIKDEDIQAIKDNLINTKGIIIDIRNYPSTFVPFSLGSYFVSSSTPFVKLTQADIYNPGEFIFKNTLEIPSQGETYKGKLVVLLNELSQSRAEYTAMAFRAGGNTTIIGSTTAGADGNVSEILLPGGLETKISGIGVYYPDGKETQRIGIIPDVEVKPTIKGIREGRDELLEKAIKIITEY